MRDGMQVFGEEDGRRKKPHRRLKERKE